MSTSANASCVLHGLTSPCRLDGCLFTSPWVPGTRAAGYYGPVEYVEVIPSPAHRRNRPRTWERGILRALRRLVRELRRRGGNSLVGLEVSLDPFHADGGLRVRVLGTGATLEPLWDPVLADSLVVAGSSPGSPAIQPRPLAA